MAASCQVIYVSRWSWFCQKIPVLLQVCIWSFLLDNARCSALGGLVVCVSCATPSYTHAQSKLSFASITTLVTSNTNPTPVLTRTVMTSTVSTANMWSISESVKIRYHSITSTNVVTPVSTLTKVVKVTSAKSSVSTTSLNTQIARVSYSPDKSPTHHEITVSSTSSSVEYQASSVEYKSSSVEYQSNSVEYQSNSVEYQSSSVEYQASSVEYQASSVHYKVPKRCSGECGRREGATEPPSEDEGFQLTLPIKYGFLAAGMAVPFIICIVVAVCANYRFQRQQRRKQRARALNGQRVAPVHLSRINANGNSLSQFLTVPGRELIPLNTIRREAHINYACSDDNAHQFASAQV